MAFEGWNDAAEAASGAVEYLLNTYENREIGSIRSDDYYDLQTARPIQCTTMGRRRIVWPQTTFYDVKISAQLRLVLGVGPEPNFHWKRYCAEVLRFAEDCDVDSVITLGSLFAECPHTRELPANIVDYSDPTVDDTAYSGPVGILTILGAAAAEMDFSSHSLWVSIPDYIGTEGCPEGSLKLLRQAGKLIHYVLNEAELAVQAKQWLAEAQMFVRYNDRLSEYVADLERRADEGILRDAIAPGTAKKLIFETEEFLRSLDNASGI